MAVVNDCDRLIQLKSEWISGDNHEYYSKVSKKWKVKNPNVEFSPYLKYRRSKS
jgi:hypothetical protein